ncbi:MAG TPA: aa3-type cytochrome c oxidase subunit IV [Caulobacteraceae bacterium]|nr:aa3-type cytochrome c oxidase subunit IV [Caulobacteraceae bacterium]
MDVNEFEAHARTYHRFSLAVKWFVIHFAVISVFLTLWFATPAGLGWALIAAIVVGAVAIWAMRHGLARSSEREVQPPSGPPVAHA